MHCRLKSKSREHPKSRRWTQSHVKWQHSRGRCWRHRKRLWEKECRPLPEARRARKRILPQLPSRSNTSPTHFRLLTSWTVQWWIYVVLSHCMLSRSLQSCPTLCDPIDSSPPGSPVPGILQARTLELPFPSPMHEREKWKWSCSVVSDSSRPHGLQPTRLLRPWDFPGKSTGVGCHCLLCIFH